MPLFRVFLTTALLLAVPVTAIAQPATGASDDLSAEADTLNVPADVEAETAAEAEAAEVPAPRAASAAAEGPTWKAGDALQVAILKEITARKRRTRDADMSRRLDELGTLYANGFAGPLWVGADGATERARKVTDELSRADEWGLDPDAYRVNLPDYGLYMDGEKARYELEFALNVLKYVDHARRGRFRPTEMSLWYESASNKTDHMELLRVLETTAAPADLLVAQHPQHEGFNNLRRVYLARKWPDRFPLEPVAEETAEKTPERIVLDYGDAVTRGKRHPQIPLLRARLKVPADSATDEDLYDRELMEAVNSFMRTQGWRRKHVYDDKVRTALNGANGVEGDRRRSKTRVSLDDIVANMEKWRWLPRDLGSMHIWNNLPSFRTQVVKDGRVIHEERIIIGKTETQTPVFSDTMTHVVFKPQWGVPNSIKIKSLLPSLAGGDLDVLRRRGMQIQFDNKVVSPSRYDWGRTDIRSIPIVMSAGSSNPLGRVKFMFPNHHAVYMHDTPDRDLFNSSTRLFSHGCIRVRDPIRFAEVILGETSNWNDSQVAAHLASRSKENNRVDLDRKVGVHNTYFTVLADGRGELETLPDIYGHDKRIKQALSGTSLTVIARSDPARIHKQKIDEIAANRTTVAYNKKTRRSPQPAPSFFGNAWALGGPEPAYAYNPPKPAYKKKNKQKKRRSHVWSVNPWAPYGRE